MLDIRTTRLRITEPRRQRTEGGMRRLFIAVATAAVVGLTGVPSAGAAPANGIVIDRAASTLDVTENVHCRPYRHWHSWGFGYGCRRGWYGGYWRHHHRHYYHRHWYGQRGHWHGGHGRWHGGHSGHGHGHGHGHGRRH